MLSIPTMVNTVRISGNVMYPNTVTYDSRLKVKDFIDMAGGYGLDAKKNAVYIVYMNGTVARAKRGGRDVVEPGCEIVVPGKRKNSQSLEKILSIATTSSSIATMIATIGNIILR